MDPHSEPDSWYYNVNIKFGAITTIKSCGSITGGYKNEKNDSQPYWTG